MGDLFDEFKRELERRRAEAEGRPLHGEHDDDGHGTEPPNDDDDGPDGDDPDGAHDEHGADDDQEAPEPVPLRRRRARTGSAAGGPPRRPRAGFPVGGPNDGAEPPSLRTVLRRAGLVVAVVVVLAVLALAGTGIDLWTDATWYKSVGFDGVFWTRLGGQAGLFVLGFVVALVVLLVNIWASGRLIPPLDPERPGRFRAMTERLSEAQQQQAERTSRMARPGGNGPFGGGPFGPTIRMGGDGAATFSADDIPDLTPIAGWAIAAVAVLVALGLGGALSSSWSTVALWAHRVPYSATSAVTDPIFGKDISFFLFELPFFRLVQALVNGLLLASLVAAGARYVLALARGGEVFVTRVRVHLAILGGLYLLSIAFGYQLDKFELVYGQSGVATGVAYADVHARFAAYDVLTMLSGIAGALLIAGAFTRWMWPLGVVVGVWAIASLLLGTVYPQIIQRLYVDPNKYSQEEPYIANNIAMTRLAYGLDQWQTQQYAGNQALTAADVTTEADTFTNARLWDYRPLQDTLDQLQTIKQYYDFVDVDTDRYLINGQLRQVMLSGRELAIAKNSNATGWVNQRIIYTHGVGVTMVPVNAVTAEGQPELWIRDLPPASSNGAPPVTEPRIYFGESDNHYVVVGAAQSEFDLPGGSGGAATDTTSRWTGTSGISLDSTFNRLMFALRFKDLDLLISTQITAQSQLLFHRTLSDRLGLIAPFLRYDKDPYLVVDNGRLVYVQDAYTISDRFPQATPFDASGLAANSGLAADAFNYIRNSVKITMDAYTGTLHFYVSDKNDPIIRAWQGIFPSMFEQMDAMPASLAAHIRTPEELFDVQTRTFGQYHVTNTLTFFNNTDRWTVPAPQTNQQSLPSEAYYVVMRVPGESEAEFLLLQPMIAASRPNMIAWVAARNDAPNYGAVRVFQFPSDTTVFGPAQIEARIDQDPIISAQITLWNQSGSTVKRGNLIVVPVGNSLIYLQPVYLQSTSSAFPEFQKIVVATPTSVVWANTLQQALNQLLAGGGGSNPGTSPSPSPGPTASPGSSASPGPSPSVSPGGLPTDIPGLVAYANAHFEAAQAALRNGDFATYGAEMGKVNAALQQLGVLTAQPGASTTP